MGITNSGAFPKQVDRTIVDMFYDQFVSYKPLWPALMKKSKAPKGQDYTRADLAGLGSQLRETGEGEAVDYDVPSEGNKVQRFYKKYTLGFQVTEEMLEDELFDKMSKMSASLAKCANYTIESKVWALFNGAFSGGGTLGKDGQALIIGTHKSIRSPTVNANINLIVGDLDTTTLQQAFEFFQTITGEDDLPAQTMLSKLIVPLSEQWKAAELLKATGRVFDSGSLISSTYAPTGDRSKPAYNAGLNNQGTAGYPSYPGMNLMNPNQNVVSSWDYIPSRFLTDADAWFAISDEFDGEVLFKRDVTLQSADDVATGNRLYRASTRFLPHIEEYRFICGSAGV
jgi:hypothetical protein